MGIANTVALLGGLAFFLFGMTLLGDGLKRVAGSKLEPILGKLTSTTFRHDGGHSKFQQFSVGKMVGKLNFFFYRFHIAS